MLRRALLALGAFASVALVACSDDEPTTPSASLASDAAASPTTTSTTEPRTVEQEVEAAYLRSWDVYAEAMRTFDTSALGEMYIERALELRTDEVEALAAANTPARMSVEHDYSISVADDGQTALVVDHYVNHSVLIDPESGEPTEPDPNTVVKREYELRLVEGSWKVAQVFEG